MSRGIVDMRVRPPLGPWTAKPQFQSGNYYPARAGFPRPPSATASSVDLLFAEMDEVGVEWAVIAGRRAKEPLGIIANEEVGRALASYPDRLLGQAAVDANDDPAVSIAEIDRCLAQPGFRGVAIEPAAARDPMHADDARLEPIYDHCARRGIPVTITLSMELARLVAQPVTFASPLPLFNVAQRFPELSIVVAHAAWPWVQEMLGLAFAFPNIWLSPDLYMVGRDVPFATEFVKAANLYLGDRIVFGTGYPSRGHIESVRAFDEWTFAPGVKEKVMRHNARRLLRLD